MVCPKCSAILEEDSKFCVSCGTNLDEVSEDAPITPGLATSVNDLDQQETKKSKTSESKKSENNKQRMLGLIVGTFIIAIGIIRIMTAGTSISSTSFGGDFYTYTYQGIVAVSEILASIEVSLGWIIVAIGSAIDIYTLRH